MALGIGPQLGLVTHELVATYQTTKSGEPVAGPATVYAQRQDLERDRNPPVENGTTIKQTESKKSRDRGRRTISFWLHNPGPSGKAILMSIRYSSLRTHKERTRFIHELEHTILINSNFFDLASVIEPT